MTILYGMPDDPDHFREYYYAHHIPLAKRMRGLTGWNLSWVDRDEEDPNPYLLIAELYAESRAAMDEILASPEGQAARDDVPNFATGTVDFLPGEQEEVPLA
ncbi:MAG: EthD family reductase [Streptosporangiales bacterium]